MPNYGMSHSHGANVKLQVRSYYSKRKSIVRRGEKIKLASVIRDSKRSILKTPSCQNIIQDLDNISLHIMLRDEEIKACGNKYSITIEGEKKKMKLVVVLPHKEVTAAMPSA